MENSEFMEESGWQKFSRKLKQEPLIPFGQFSRSTYLFEAESHAS